MNSYIPLENKIFGMDICLYNLDLSIRQEEDLIMEKADLENTTDLGKSKLISTTLGPSKISRLITIENTNLKFQSKLSISLIEKMYNDFTKLVPIKDINDIFEKSSDILCSTLKWEQVSFIMIDPKLIEVFEAEDRGFVTHILIDHWPMVIAHQNTQFYQRMKINRDNLINTKDEETYGKLDIWFKSVEEAYNGLNK